MNKINLQWHYSSNFGDALNEWLIPKIFNRPIQYVPQSCTEEHYVCIGSILAGSNKNSIIWGAGCSNDIEPIPMNKQILMVRGKYTRERVLKAGYDCPEVYGDPALLCSKYYNPEIPKKYKVGFTPNWVDHQIVESAYKKEIESGEMLLINLLEPCQDVIDKMLSCEFIVSRDCCCPLIRNPCIMG